MSPIKIGFVGLSAKGWASRALAPGLLDPSLSSSYLLTAVSTTSAESAEASAKKYSEAVGHTVKAYYGDTSKIANDPEVELVAVSVKAPAHKAALLPAIEAGKDIFVEWPAGVGLKESTELAEAAKKKGIRTIIGLQARQSPVIAKVKEILRSGVIGKVISTSVISAFPREFGNWGPAYSEPYAYAADISNGVSLLSIAVGHFLDAFTYLLGDFASVSAHFGKTYQTASVVDEHQQPTGKTIEVTVPDQIAFSGVLKSGVVTSLSWRGGLPSTKGRKQLIWVIDGDEGSIQLESDNMGGGNIGLVDPRLYLNGELVAVENGSTAPSHNLTRAWKEYAKGEQGFYATFDDALKLHRLLDGITRSAEERKVIDL